MAVVSGWGGRGRHCEYVNVDGDEIRVQTDRPMTAEERAAFAEVVRAAKARFAALPAPVFTHDPCCSAHGEAMNCARYRRTHFVEVRPCCEADAAALGVPL